MCLQNGFYHFLPALHHRWLLAGEAGTSGGSMPSHNEWRATGVGSAKRRIRRQTGPRST